MNNEAYNMTLANAIAELTIDELAVLLPRVSRARLIASKALLTN